MSSAPLPADEAQRLARLRALAVLDTPPEPLFDQFARLAAQIAGTPIALVSLVDASRQWFKAQVGLNDMGQTPREHALCAHAILDSALMEVPDAGLDPRFADNPLVTGEPHLRFYAGAPLVMPGGERLGTLCVIDRVPRELSAAQREQLAQLSQAVCEALLLRERGLDRALAAYSAYESELAGHVRALSAILDRLPVGVSVWDRELRNAYANAVVQQRTGRDAATLLGRPLAELIGEAACAEQRAYHQAVLDGQAQAFETQLPRADGKLHDVRIQLVPFVNEQGRIDGMVALSQDMSLRAEMDAAQRALAQSERTFRALSEASPIGVFHTDAQGQCTYTNAAWQAIYGMNLEESLGEGWSRHLHPDDRDQVFAEWQRSAATGQDFTMEFRVQRRDGSVREVRARSRELRDEAGRLAGHVGTVEDVTDARAAQARLRESQAFLDRTGRIAGVGGWEVDLVREEVRWSDQTCRIHDLPPGHQPTLEEAVAYYAPEARETIMRALERAVAAREPFDLELPMVTARGRRIWVRAQGEAQFEGGRAVRAIGAVQDVTWRHEAAQALRQLYEKTPAILHSIDPDGRILSVSDLWLAKMGYVREEVIGRASLSFFAPASAQRRREELRALWATGRSASATHELRRRDGSALYIVAQAVVQRDAAGAPLRALVVSEDVSELLARTDELRREQRQRLEVERHAQELDALLAERNEMLDVLAHEVRQPLNNASAALQSAATALDEPGSRDAAALRIERAQAVMHAVLSGVDNTLAAAALLGRAESAAPLMDDADIDTLLGLAIGDMPAGARDRVRIERATTTRTAAMDLGLMRLALRNLIANALRWSPPGEAVTLRIADSDEPLALVVEVIDRGPGIAAELLPRLFERGARGRHPTGRASHGLGLYIVRRALELQGGRAELAATGPGGTTIRLWLAQDAVAGLQTTASGARNK